MDRQFYARAVRDLMPDPIPGGTLAPNVAPILSPLLLKLSHALPTACALRWSLAAPARALSAILPVKNRLLRMLEGDSERGGTLRGLVLRAPGLGPSVRVRREYALGVGTQDLDALANQK